MEIVMKKVDELIPYVNNPRNNADAVDKVASSIKNFGFKVPIVIDKNNEIVTGHTRILASKKLKLKKVPCIVANDLTDAQIKAYRIADNKVAEFSEWDDELLKIELDTLKELDVDLDITGFDIDDIDDIFDKNIDENDNEYTMKVDSPTYEAKQDKKPELEELYNTDKANELIEKINNSKLNKNIKEFLIYASYRHIKFNYKMIAEYYCHTTKEEQELIEDSALVIIDFDKAIENGYVKMNDEISRLYGEEYEK